MTLLAGKLTSRNKVKRSKNKNYGYQIKSEETCR